MLISLVKTTHNFTKQNLFTLSTRNRPAFEKYRCNYCGLEGIRSGVNTVLEVKSKKASDNCPAVKLQAPRLIVVDRCVGIGQQFDPLTTGTIRVVVDPPEDQKTKFPNSQLSVWVKGLNEPVRLLTGEFVAVSSMPEAIKVAMELKK